jgi:sialate O-acetylesterase
VTQRVPAAVATLLLASGFAFADVELPAVISDHMVVQSGEPVTVWGWADAREPVTVRLGGQEVATKADGDGRWTVDLPEMRPGGPHELVVKGNNEITVSDVLVGEVWVCSGQSNMNWRVRASNDADAEQAAAKHPGIRMFTVAPAARGEPQERCAGSWVVCSPETVGAFSAVGYYFGRELHGRLKVPVGLLHTSWGGTPAEAWAPGDSIRKNRFLRPLHERWAKSLSSFDGKKAAARHRRQLEKWKKDAAKAKAAGKRAPRRPRAPVDPDRSPHAPGRLWNGMVQPLLPYPVRGVIWYQGESNAGRAHQYRTLFPLMIECWREGWGRPDLPFGFVQLANFGARPRGQAVPSGGDSMWAELREAQVMTLREVENTGMAVTIDIGNVTDIHPRNKQDVGKRLAAWALGSTYGKDVSVSGPLFRKRDATGKGLRLRFDHADDLRTTDGKDPAGFAVAAQDGKWIPAKATIVRGAVEVFHPKGRRVVHVRYAWSDAPSEPLNLVNGAGLPASPFRTDDLPCTTEGKH